MQRGRDTLRSSIFHHPIRFHFSFELRTERVCDIRGRASHKIGRIWSTFSRRSQGKEIFQVSFYTVTLMVCSTTYCNYFTWRFYLISWKINLRETFLLWCSFVFENCFLNIFLGHWSFIMLHKRRTLWFWVNTTHSHLNICNI